MIWLNVLRIRISCLVEVVLGKLGLNPIKTNFKLITLINWLICNPKYTLFSVITETTNREGYFLTGHLQKCFHLLTFQNHSLLSRLQNHINGFIQEIDFLLLFDNVIYIFSPSRPEACSSTCKWEIDVWIFF